jgi:hypothetical protein
MQEMDFLEDEKFAALENVDEYSRESVDDLLENDEITANEAALMTSRDLML